MQHRKSGRSKTLGIIVAVMVFAIPMAVYFIVSDSDASANPQKTVPSTLIGKWNDTGDVNGLPMEAEISVGSIQINMLERDSTKRSSIYWLGSFDTDKDPTKPFKYTSLGDQDAMSMSIMGSQDPTKDFTYKNGVLSFKMSIMGTTSTVELTKG